MKDLRDLKDSDGSLLHSSLCAMCSIPSHTAGNAGGFGGGDMENEDIRRKIHVSQRIAYPGVLRIIHLWVVHEIPCSPLCRWRG